MSEIASALPTIIELGALFAALIAVLFIFWKMFIKLTTDHRSERKEWREDAVAREERMTKSLGDLEDAIRRSR